MRNAIIKMTAAMIASLAPVAASADWHKSWVVEWNEAANYFGSEQGVIDPGTDCPEGTNPEIDWVQVLIKAGYTQEEAEWLRNPANPTRSPVHGQNQMAFRGKDRANVYVNPTSYPDPGFTEVSGKIGEGIDLDGNDDTGFVSPDGEAGIDNTFYKALGCWKTYRGPERLSSGALQFNDGMRNGSWTMVIVAEGQGSDPMNDDNVKVGFYMSKDPMVKGGDGEISTDYTYRIDPHARYEGIFPARIDNGKIVSTQPVAATLRNPGYVRDLELLQAQVKLELEADGSLTGYVGGYRPWEPEYFGWVGGRGPVIESLTWAELPSIYYALRRNADYSPDGPNGEKTHISYALRIDALPAFVVEPDASDLVTSVVSYKHMAPPPDDAPVGLFSRIRIVDGIVIDSNAEHQAGPNAVILPLSKNN